MTHFLVTKGEVQKKQTIVTRRKFPLKEIRHKTLKAQEQYMRLNSNEEIDAMIEYELTLKLSQLNIVPGDDERKSLKHCQDQEA